MSASIKGLAVGYPAGNASELNAPGNLPAWTDAVDWGTGGARTAERLQSEIERANRDLTRAMVLGPGYPSSRLEEMVRMRLRTPAGSRFEHWHMHKIADEKVVVLVINKGETVLLEDEWPLFPSDTLITKLRLLEK